MNTADIPNHLKRKLPEAVQRKVAEMDAINREAFLSEFKKKGKSTIIAFVLFMSLPCFHYLYLGKIWLNLLFWVSVGGFGIWWLVDLFRVTTMVREYNRTVAITVLKEIQVLN